MPKKLINWHSASFKHGQAPSEYKQCCEHGNHSSGSRSTRLKPTWSAWSGQPAKPKEQSFILMSPPPNHGTLRKGDIRETRWTLKLFLVRPPQSCHLQADIPKEKEINKFPKYIHSSLVDRRESQTLYAAAAAKSLQSCPTLCDPIDGSPPGSSVPGILQARILEWAAISFSNACMHAKSLQSCLTL